MFNIAAVWSGFAFPRMGSGRFVSASVSMGLGVRLSTFGPSLVRLVGLVLSSVWVRFRFGSACALYRLGLFQLAPLFSSSRWGLRRCVGLFVWCWLG